MRNMKDIKTKMLYWTEKTLRSGYFWAVFLPLFATYLTYLCIGKSISMISLFFQSFVMFPWELLKSLSMANAFGKFLSTTGISYIIPLIIGYAALLLFVFKARTMKRKTLFIISAILIFLYVLGLVGWITELATPLTY